MSHSPTLANDSLESSDEELVERLAKRDELALRELIARYSDLVRRVCLYICPPSADTHALVADVFWEFWQRATNFDPIKGSVRSYLLVIARSRAIDYRRSELARNNAMKRMLDSTAQTELEVTLPIDPVAYEEKMEVLRALQLLPEEQRSAIELAFLDGLSHQQVANQLATPLGTIKTRIRTGLLRLRELLACEETIQ